MKIKKLLFSALLAVSCGLATADQYTPQKLVVFGDSLGDMGNFYRFTEVLGLEPAIPPSEEPFLWYWEGRFSNGPVWPEYLAQELKVDLEASIDARARKKPRGINFAWGGATSSLASPNPSGLIVPGLLGQVELYKLRFVRNREISPDTLHAIWIGADDILLGFSSTPEEIDGVVDNIVQAIHNLDQLGARRYVVANLPELCGLPLGDTGCFSEIYQGVPPTPALYFNYALQQALSDLAKQIPDAEFFLVDIYSAAAELFTDDPSDPADPFLPPVAGPAAFCLASLGLDPLPDNCAYIDPALLGPIAENGPHGRPPYLDGALWDEQHPTSYVHSIISDVMIDALENEPLPNM